MLACFIQLNHCQEQNKHTFQKEIGFVSQWLANDVKVGGDMREWERVVSACVDAKQSVDG